MLYKTEIEDSFKRIGFEPINNQVESVDKVVTAFLDEKADNVVLSASTGTGKSVIGIVVAETVHNLIGSENPLKSLVLMQNNLLVQQYHDSFDGHEGFWQIRGTETYPCHISKTGASASECIFEFLTQKSVCNSCEYLISRKKRNDVSHLITNYSYLFAVGNSPVEVLKPRFMNIYDEAHTISEIFVEHKTLKLNEELLTRLKNAAKLVNVEHSVTDELIKTINNNTFKNKLYENYLNDLDAEISDIFLRTVEFENAAFTSGNREEYFKFKYLNAFLENLTDLINGYIGGWFDFVIQKIDDTIYFKPIYADWIKEPYTPKKKLFMSATISEEMLKKTMNLKGKTKEIILDPIFKKENKKFIFIRPISINYHSLQEQRTVDYITEVAENIIDSHPNEKGIILTPSFKLAETISDKLSQKHNIILHNKGEKITDCLSKYTKSKTGTTLISPSIFEGLNLPDDLCRYQFLVKAPFPSLSDKRIEYIMNNDPDLYNWMTLVKIIQGAGRGVRNIEDYAVTYTIDNNIKKLFMSDLNKWINEFDIEEF